MNRKYQQIGGHIAPTAESVADGDSAIFSDVSELYPGFYDMGIGELEKTYPGQTRAEYEEILRSRGNPDSEVKIYRAVPKGVDTINPGDWVAISDDYATNHGEVHLKGDYHIISAKVPAKYLANEGNSVSEWGYIGDVELKNNQSMESSTDLNKSNNNHEEAILNLPDANLLDVKSVHEDMVLAERYLSISNGYIASSGMNKSEYHAHLKERFKNAPKNFDDLPKPKDVDFGDQAATREYSDYYDLRGYDHHKTVSYYTNDKDKEKRLQAAHSHLSSFEERLESDAKYNSMQRHIDRQCSNMGITADQREEMQVKAEQDFNQAGAVSSNNKALSALEMKKNNISKDQADLHKLRCQREDMVREGNTNSDEYKELMGKIDEQRQEAFLDPVQNRQEALEQMKEGQAQENDQELEQPQQEHELNAEEELLDRKKPTDQEQGQYEASERDESIEQNEVHPRPAVSEEVEQNKAEETKWDLSSNESILKEASREEMDEEALEAERIVRQQEMASMRSSSDSAAMGGEIEVDYELDDQEPVEYDLDEDEELDIDESLEIEDTPEFEQDDSEELAREAEENLEFEEMVSELVDEHYQEEIETTQDEDLEITPEPDMSTDPSEEIEEGLDVEPSMEDIDPAEQNLEDAYQNTLDDEDALEFEEIGGLSEEEEFELDGLMDDLEGNAEQRELDMDQGFEKDKENEYSM